MNTGVELHDSRVANLVREGGDLRIVFEPAYVHHSDGIPGSNSGWGLLQPVEFRFRDATCSEMGECLGDVADGVVVAADVEYANLVPLPLSAEGASTARIEFASGGVLTITAGAFSCNALGDPDPNFRERYEG